MNKCQKITFEFADFVKTLEGQTAADFYNKLCKLFPENVICTLEQKNDLSENDKLFITDHEKWLMTVR